MEFQYYLKTNRNIKDFWTPKMIEVKPIGNWTGILVRLENANLVMIVASKGFVGCGYFNLETAERVGDALAIVTDVTSFDDVLSAKIIKASTKAKQLGVRQGITGQQALELLS